MEPTDGGRAHEIIELDVGDIAGGLLLSAEAGWNQSASDWAMILGVGRGFGIRGGGRLVATGFALPYPPQFGWVSMVLVTGSHRRRGLASALLERAIVYLTGLGLTPMLDATPAGRKVYLPLGFQDVEPISRWRRSGGHPVRGGPAAGPFGLEAALGADRVAFGADRSTILRNLAERPGAFAASKPSGAFLLSRAGTTATQIGPVVADRSDEAVDLLGQAIDKIAGALLVDVPDRETEMANLLERRGFAMERPFIRMALGRGESFGKADRVRAIAGPELG
jgi:GNAT superfamily N-acetyltransferase